MRKPLSIVVVESDPIHALHLKKVVEEAGHEFLGWAIRAREAVELVETRAPDLVFMDVSPDGLDQGSRAVSRVMEAGGRRLVLTADPAEAAALGPDARVLLKPFDPDDVRAILAEELGP